MRLKVMVRVRPMSQREKKSGSQNVVRVESNNNIAVTNIKVPEQNAGDSRERVRRFAFDYCLSEDVTQEQIFESIDAIIGTSLKSRNHSCVLAYGQTSSGKTHTMMGFPHDPGLTPRLCRKIFNYFEDGALNDEASRLKVTVSYLEIYNEKVADLLTKCDSKGQVPEKHLKVREHPKKGPYVEGLSEHPVTNDTELLERLEAGSSKRRVGSTATNPKSSRSHSVFSITCDGVKLHLVDLAGNERAGSRGYGPNRFREGANINKSLVALGNVISTLADQSKSSTHSRNKFVPYRDSVLTWLLKDTLQGNSNTVMIATISPSSASYNETVNTLRFGQRAKLIVYKPVIVEDPKEKTIKELRAEIARLRDLLMLSQQITPSINPDGLMTHQHNAEIKEIPEESELVLDQDQVSSHSSTLASSITSLSEQLKEIPKNADRNTENDNSLLTSNSLEEENSLKSGTRPTTPTLIHKNNTSEKLLPVMSVKSSVLSATPKKLKRTFSIDRKYSIDTDNSKSFSSQESLPSPKHNSARKAIKGSGINSKESVSTSTGTRRLSSGSSSGVSSVQPKPTALSLRRQSIHKSTPSLKAITQKKILVSTAKKPEKGVVTEIHGTKKAESKIDTGRKPPYAKPRSQIVAGVTSRLYSKVNKKDMATSTENLENIVKEPPKELTICSNARNKLRELTQRALKAHRSRNEETQTELFPVLRVKEVATDCLDLKQETGEVKDASTLDKSERKDAEVECTLLNQFIEGTLNNILVLTRSCGIQTTEEKTSSVSFTKYLTESRRSPIFAEAVNINISHNYINENRSGSLSDDSLDNNRNNNGTLPTPDLISNHNSLEQQALNSSNVSEDEEPIKPKICYSESKVLTDCFDSVKYIPANNIQANTASVLTVPQYNKKIKKVEVLTTHAPETITEDVLMERCRSLPDFCPRAVKPKVKKHLDSNSSRSCTVLQEKNIFKCDDCKSLYSSSDSSTEEDNRFSDIPDSMDYHISNQKKVQFESKNRIRRDDRLLKVMKEFLEEAKLLMTNITSTANDVHSNHCQQPHLDDFDIQVTVNEISGIDKSKRKRRKRIVRGNNSTQTEEPSMESSFSQTSLDYPEYMIPINKYEELLEDSCKRLEEKIKRPSRSRHVSITSEDYDDDILFQRPEMSRYNPWDLSHVEIEDSSLESNPVTFSDYGSLPRKAYKRQRTPTCSPSAFLRQLTQMRRQVIETTRDELLQCSSSSK